MWHTPEYLLATAVLASVCAILMVIVAAVTAGKVTFFDAQSWDKGTWNGAAPLFVYHADECNLNFTDDTEGRYLGFANRESQQWQGFGMMGDLSVPASSWLRVVWRNTGDSDRFISVFITDKSADQSGHGRPENFMSSLLLPKGDWTETIIPLSQFVRNSWQETGASNDGILNSNSLQKVEFGFGPSGAGQIDVRTMELVWENPPRPAFLFSPVFILITGLFLLLFRNPSRYHKKNTHVAEGRLALALAALFSIASIWSQPSHAIVDWVPQVILAVTLVLSLVDEFVCAPFQHTIWWRLRFVFAPCLYLVSSHPASLLVDLFFLPILLPPLLRQKNLPVYIGGLAASFGTILIRRQLVEGTMEFYPAAILGCEVLILLGIYWYLQLKNQGLDSHIASHLYQGVLSLTQDMILILDQEGTIEHMNHGAEATLGMNAQQARGKALEDLFTMKVKWKEFLEQLQENTESRTMELQALDEWGGRTYYSIRIQRFSIERWQSRFIVMMRDISRQKHLEEELRAANARLSAIAFLDGLTGISSRRAFDQSMDLEWKRSRRSRTPLGLLLIDVDHFKAYNDTNGHLKGDDALRLIASCLKSFSRRPEDVCARYGGEEFVLLFPGMNKENLIAMAEGIRSAVEALHIENPHTRGWLTVSVGGVSSSANPSESTPSGLIHVADTALYKAKNDGRNRICISNTNSGSI